MILQCLGMMTAALVTAGLTLTGDSGPEPTRKLAPRFLNHGNCEMIYAWCFQLLISGAICHMALDKLILLLSLRNNQTLTSFSES